MGQQPSTPQAPAQAAGQGAQGGPSWLGSLGISLSSNSLVSPFQTPSSSSSAAAASDAAVVMKVRRVYLDLSNRDLRALIPPPHELDEFIRPSFSSSGADVEFIYLEAISLAHNQLTFLGDGLLQIKHLPLLMELDVSYNQLDSLDEEVCELMGTLERLNISHNRLAYLPSNMYLLHNLRELNAGHNDIVYLPEELSHLQQLHYLNLAANNLYSLPDSCAKLRGLKTLILCNNQLEVVSPKLGELTQLTWLDISWNQLDSFPRNLPESLKKLYAGHNRIRAVDGDAIRRLRHLKELSLPSNKLTKLPRELLDLVSSLRVLDVEDNRFSDRDLTTTEVLTAFAKARSQPGTPQEERQQAQRLASTYAPRDPGFFVEGYSNHLYRFKGRDRIVMQAVAVAMSSLNEGDSFVLDIGRKLFVWTGAQSNPRERAKAKYIANLLSAEELAGIPVIVINEEDDPEFWETLGGRRAPIKSADKGGDDGEAEARFAESMVLYKFSQGPSGPQLDVIEGFEMPFFKSLLNHHYSYVLHCQQNIFVWCGKDCSSRDRIRAHAKAEEIANQVGENAFADISWQIDGAETIFFREQFVDWSDEADWQPELDRELHQGTAAKERTDSPPPRRRYGDGPGDDDAYDEPQSRPNRGAEKPLRRKPAERSRPSEEAADERVREGEREDGQLAAKKKTRRQVREAKQQQQQQEGQEAAPAAGAGSGLVKKVGADAWQQELDKRKEAERQEKDRRAETLRKRETERQERERREAERRREEERQREERERQRQQKEREWKQREEEQRKREADERRRRQEREKQEADERKRREEAERGRQKSTTKEQERQKREEDERQRRQRDEAERKRQREAEEQRKREAELEARKKLEDEERRRQQQAASAAAPAARPSGGSVIASRTSGGSTLARTKQVGGLTVDIDVCESCQKRVYITEKISVEGKSFHKNCFRCTHCNTPLKPGNYASLQGKPFCKPHFKQLFQLKGNYASGFGELTPEEAWKSKNEGTPAAAATIPAAKEAPQASKAVSASITVKPPSSVPEASVRAVAVELATHPPAKIYDDTVVRLAREFPELGLDRVEEAVNLFDKWDTRGAGRLTKAQFLRLMQQVIGANKFARGPIYQRLVELSFDYVDTGRKGALEKRQFLASYNLLFSNERKQMALLLTKDFPGLTVEEIEGGLKKFEEQEKLDMDEFYQLKEELDENLKGILKQILNIVEPSAAADTTKIVSALKHSLELLPVEEKSGASAAASAGGSTAPRPVGQAPPSQRTATIRAADGSPDALWNEFRAAEKLLDVVRSFEALKQACGVDRNQQGVEVFHGIKAKVVNKNAETFWKLLEHRMAQVEYAGLNKTSPPRAVIVGSGPGGLRTAIEFAFLGVRATVLEKRLDYSRNNLLHIWHSSIRDLKNIGAKYFHPQFCTGGINHIAIRTLQLLLLKVALLLGVKFLPGVSYTRTDDALHRAKPQTGLWRVVIGEQGKPDFVGYRDEDLVANIIVGADGENSLVAKDFDFERKVLQGSRAIGITANFVNTHTPAENQIKEFGILRVYNQQFFTELNNKYGVDLENLVYYRGETHYFVMTAMIKSLLDKGVLKAMQTDASQLLARDNLDVQKLRSFVTEVADHTGLPSSCPFAPNHAGVEDVAIFDFSKKQQSVTPFKIVGDQEGNRLLVALVGDALIEPFWPLGTGANRAILSALDTTWMIKGLYGNNGKQVSTAQLQQLETQWQDSFKIMMNSSPDDLVSNFGLHTIDPKTRYKKNSMSRFH